MSAGKKNFQNMSVCLPDWVSNFLKSNFENYSRYSLVKWYQFLSVEYSMSNTSLHFRHMFLLSACSSQNHATSCSSLMSHYWVNIKAIE